MIVDNESFFFFFFCFIKMSLQRSDWNRTTDKHSRAINWQVSYVYNGDGDTLGYRYCFCEFL